MLETKKDAPEATTTCPPHLWDLQMVEIEGEFYDHHTCRHCGAQKDVPRQSSYKPTWPKRNTTTS